MMNMAGLCFPGEGCYQVLAVTRYCSGRWFAAWCRDFTVKKFFDSCVTRIDEGYSFGYCPSPHSKITSLILDIFFLPPQRFPLFGILWCFPWGVKRTEGKLASFPYAVEIKILWSCNSATLQNYILNPGYFLFATSEVSTPCDTKTLCLRCKADRGYAGILSLCCRN